MAIAYDNSAAYIGIGTGTHSWSYTVGSGANRYLMVLGNNVFNGFTYNGVSASVLINVTSSISDGNQQTVKVYGIASPASGANTLDVNIGTNDMAVLVVSYSGVYQGVQPEASNYGFTNNGLINTQAVSHAMSVSSISAGSWGVYFNINSNGSRSMTANQGTLRQCNQVNIGTQGGAIIDSNGPITPAGGTFTGEAQLSSSTAFMGSVAFSLQPAYESAGAFMPYFI